MNTRIAWVSMIGKELLCRREPTNQEDRFAVMISAKDSTIVRHVARKIL